MHDADGLERLRELRGREQLHHDRSWLLATLIAVLGALDLRTGAGMAQLHLLAPLALGLLLLSRTRLIASCSVVTDRLAMAIQGDASGHTLPPLRKGPPSVAIILAILAVALAVHLPF